MKDDLHSNDVHIGVGVDLPFASAHAEVTIDRTPIGVGPDARCATLVGLVSLGVLTGIARGVSLVRTFPRVIRATRAGLRDDEALRSLVVKMASRAKVVIARELDDIIASAAAGEVAES